MTHYYYLIIAGALLDETTEFYKVGVGTTRQADRDFLFLTAFAASHNYYFEKVDVESSDFYLRCQKSVAGGGDPHGTLTTRAHCVSARELVRALKKSEAVPVSENVSRNVNHQLHFLSVNYRVFKNLCRRPSPLPSGTT